MAFIGEREPIVKTFNGSLETYISQRFGGGSSCEPPNDSRQNLFYCVYSIIHGMNTSPDAKTVRRVCDEIEQKLNEYADKKERIYTTFFVHVKQNIDSVHSNIAYYNDAQLVSHTYFSGLRSVYELAKAYGDVYEGFIPYTHLFPVKIGQ